MIPSTYAFCARSFCARRSLRSCSMASSRSDLCNRCPGRCRFFSRWALPAALQERNRRLKSRMPTWWEVGEPEMPLLALNWSFLPMARTTRSNGLSTSHGASRKRSQPPMCRGTIPFRWKGGGCFTRVVERR